MKTKISIITLTLCLVVFTSCQKEDSQLSYSANNSPTVENKQSDNLKSSGFTLMSVPSEYQTDNYGNTSLESTLHTVDIEVTENGTTYIGSMTVDLADTDESLIELKISNNILYNTSLTSNFWTNHNEPDNAAKKDEHVSCIADFQDTFTDENGEKIKGRGACKAECWANTAAKFTPLLIVLL